MAHLIHNAFYELALFQGHKLFFDNIYWSYSFCRIVEVIYLDFNRHDIQIDKTRRRKFKKTTPLKKTIIVACVLHIICIERGDPHDTGYSNNI